MRSSRAARARLVSCVFALLVTLLSEDGLASLVATDLLGDALLTLDADGTPGGLLLVAGATEPSVPVAATRTTAIPAPAALLLLAAALLPTLLAARR